METLILHLIFWVVNHGPIDRSKRVNETVERVETALEHKFHLAASQQLRYLVDSLHVTDPEARLDLAHALYNGKDTVKARLQYQRLDSVADIAVRSVALQQLGVLAGMHNANEEALDHFKQTLRIDPANDEARYNYELLMKKSQQQKEEEKQKDKPKNEEPSEFAKRLKAQAEAMVLERKYPEAYNLMKDGLKKDKTVSAFDDFTKRIQKVSQINRQ
ncbi:MAG: hypothetical protein V4714_13550 [Bacteroidota bacterium]